jgi:DNA-binding NtrC family response regulator
MPKDLHLYQMRFVLSGAERRCAYLTTSGLNAEVARRLLGPAGYRVFAVNTLEALEQRLASNAYPVAMLDASGSDSVWETFVKKLAEKYPNVSLVAITDWTETPTWEQVILAGGYDSVSLDRMRDQLAEVVHSAEECSRLCADSATSRARHDALMEAVRDSIRQPPSA